MLCLRRVRFRDGVLKLTTMKTWKKHVRFFLSKYRMKFMKKYRDYFEKGATCLKDKKLFLFNMYGTIHAKDILYEGTLNLLSNFFRSAKRQSCTWKRIIPENLYIVKVRARWFRNHGNRISGKQKKLIRKQKLSLLDLIWNSLQRNWCTPVKCFREIFHI